MKFAVGQRKINIDDLRDFEKDSLFAHAGNKAQEYVNELVENSICLHLVNEKDELLATAGIIPKPEKVGYLWMMVSNAPLSCYGFSKKILSGFWHLINHVDLVELETQMDPNFPQGIRLIEWLGFTKTTGDLYSRRIN